MAASRTSVTLEKKERLCTCTCACIILCASYAIIPQDCIMYCVWMNAYMYMYVLCLTWLLASLMVDAVMTGRRLGLVEYVLCIGKCMSVTQQLMYSTCTVSCIYCNSVN